MGVCRKGGMQGMRGRGLGVCVPVHGDIQVPCEGDGGDLTTEVARVRGVLKVELAWPAEACAGLWGAWHGQLPDRLGEVVF